ncbi:MAG: alpha/beta fold hydrolase [Olsenella sp.]|nr:alpha/beta fold hydrolase [Olsenella sp.]
MFTGSIWSDSMRMTTRVNVILPDLSGDCDPLQTDELYVMYLLHGLSANADEWPRFTNIEYLAKKYNVAFVMPEVDRSFYTDMAGGIPYFRYVSQDLPAFVNEWFRLPCDREHTLVAGESMGGYGACKVGLTFPERFGGIATLSGALDIGDFGRMCADGTFPDMPRREFDLMYGGGEVPPEDDVFALLEKATARPDRPRLCQFCGKQDFLLETNRRFDARATELGYDHLYLEWEGDHEWRFWQVAIQRALQWFLGFDMESTPIW